MSNASSNPRNNYIDLIKSVACFFMVWGHVVQRTYLAENPYTNLIFQNIYTFHMPVFMGICGFLFYPSLRKEPSINSYIRYKLKNRILGLIIPMISFFIINSIFRIGVHEITISSIIHGIFFNAWFLGSLSLNTALVTFLSLKTKESLLGDVLIFSSSLPIVAVMYRGIGILMYLSFITGFILNKYNFKINFLSARYFGGVSIIYLILIFIYNNVYEPIGMSVNIWKYSLTHLLTMNVLKVLLGISSSYIFLSILYYVYRKMDSKLSLLITIGNYTLQIYLLDTFLPSLVYGKSYADIVRYNPSYYIHQYGVCFEAVITFSIAVITYFVLYFTTRLLEKNNLIFKILFYK